MSDARNLWARRLRIDFRAALAVVAILACLPLFVTSPYSLGILIVSIYFALLALGWNLLAGFTGGDPEIQRGLNKMWADQQHWPDGPAKSFRIRPEVQDFIMTAMGAVD